MTGTLKPILGYIMLGCGAGFIVTNFRSIGKNDQGFHITGVVPNNEAIVSVAQQLLGVKTIFYFGCRSCSKFIDCSFSKFDVFLTGHDHFLYGMFTICCFWETII